MECARCLTNEEAIEEAIKMGIEELKDKLRKASLVPLPNFLHGLKGGGCETKRSYHTGRGIFVLLANIFSHN